MAGGLLGFALAGAATGAGQGMIAEARAKREAAMEDLRNQRLMAREDRQFDRQTQLQDRQFDRQDARDERQWSRQQERDAMSGGDLIRLEDGTTAVRRGGTVAPLTDSEGNPVNVAQTGSDRAPPADVATAEWLINQGVASDPADAWRLVRQARENPASRASLVTQVYRSMAGNFMDQRSDEEQMEAAEQFVDRLMRQEERGAGRDAGSGNDDQQPQRPRQQQSPAPQREQHQPQAQAGPRNEQGARAGNIIGGMAREAEGGLPAGVTQEQAIQAAKEAIERGADKAAVRSRLRAMGIDPSQAGI